MMRSAWAKPSSMLPLLHVSWAKALEGFVERFGKSDIAVHLGMQDGRILLESLQRIEHGGQFLILYIDQR